MCILCHCVQNKTFDHEGLKAFKLLKASKYSADDLVSNVHARHISANDFVAIKPHCLSSLKASATYFTVMRLCADCCVQLLIMKGW